MSDNKELYEPDLISVTDDDGNEIVFELPVSYTHLTLPTILRV